MQNLSHRIKTTRIQRSLSQSELAAKTGVSQPTVANWESGSHTPRPSAIESISRALDVEEDWLLYGQLAKAQQSIEAYLTKPIRQIPVYAWPLPGEGLFVHAPENYHLCQTARENDFALRDRSDTNMNHRVLVFSAANTKDKANAAYLWSDGMSAQLSSSTEIPPGATILGRLETEIRYYA